MSISCCHCNKDIDLAVATKISFKEECPHCYGGMHSCKMCSHYDCSQYNECKEPMADRIVDKEKNNYCDYFILGGLNQNTTNQSALDAAKALFKDD